MNDGNEEPVKLQMTWVADREKSFVVMKGDQEVYIPRSLVDYRRKWKDPDRWVIEFTLPQWKVEQEELDDYTVE